MMDSSKIRNYHIGDSLYNIYEYNIFQNKKEINFISITAPPFIKETKNPGRFVEIIHSAVNPYHIETLNKQLDKVELNIVCRDIDNPCLITILK